MDNWANMIHYNDHNIKRPRAHARRTPRASTRPRVLRGRSDDDALPLRALPPPAARLLALCGRRLLLLLPPPPPPPLLYRARSASALHNQRITRVLEIGN